MFPKTTHQLTALKKKLPDEQIKGLYYTSECFNAYMTDLYYTSECFNAYMKVFYYTSECLNAYMKVLLHIAEFIAKKICIQSYANIIPRIKPVTNAFSNSFVILFILFFVLLCSPRLSSLIVAERL
mgnify:CR=1 FL=1